MYYNMYLLYKMESAKKKCCKGNDSNLVHETRVRLLNEISQMLKSIDKDVKLIKKEVNDIKTKIDDDLIVEIDKKEQNKGWWY